MPRTHRPYAAEFRRRMVDLVRAGRTPESLGEEFEPSAQAIRKWLRQADRDECTYGKPHTHGSRDRSRGRGAGERWQREHRGRALRERRRVAGVLRTFLRPPRGVHGLPAAIVHGGRQAA